MPKIRLLHVMPSLFRGGTERLLYDVLSRLDREMFDPSIACTHEAGDPQVHRRFAQIGVATWVLPPARSRLGRILALFRFLRSERFDIVHIHDYNSNVIYARIGVILARVPIIMTYNHNVRDRNWKDRWSWFVLNAFTYANVVVSEAGSISLVNDHRVTRDKVRVVLNGIDLRKLPEYAEAKANVGRGSLSDPGHRKAVAAVGRLAAWKRFDLFIEAASLLKDRRDVHFVLHGEGPQEGPLRALVDRLGLADRVCFSPWQEDIGDLYSGIDVLVVTSNYREGFGLVSAEAMAMGIPIVAVDNPTHREVVTPECGLLTSPEPQAIARAIERLLDDAELCRSLAAKGRKRAEECFDIDRQTRELARLYLEAIASRGKE